MKKLTVIGSGFGILVLLLFAFFGSQPDATQGFAGMQLPPETSFSRESLVPMLEEWNARTEVGGRNPGAESMESVAPAPIDLRAELQRLGEAYLRRHREETEATLERILYGRRGHGDLAWNLYREEELSKAERQGVLILLQVALGLARNRHPDGIAAFSEDANALVIQWIATALPDTGEPQEKLLSVLRMPGVLRKDDLRTLESLESRLTITAMREALAGLLSSLLLGFTTEEISILESLLVKPDPVWQRIAAENLLRLDPHRLERVSHVVMRLPAEQASLLLGSLCNQAPLDEIPGLIARLEGSEPPGTSHTNALVQYLKRAGIDRFQDIVRVRGTGENAAEFRKEATIAVNLSARAQHLDKKKTLEFFSNILRDDRSARVRGPALLALANHWDPKDAEGFQAILDLATGDPAMEGYAQTALQVFSKTPDPEIQALTEEARKLSKKK